MHRCSIDEVDLLLQIASLSKRYVEQLIHTLDRFSHLDPEISNQETDNEQQDISQLEAAS